MNLPLKSFILYILFTMFLHVFGPWYYEDETLLPTVFFMLCVLTLFSIGYIQVINQYTLTSISINFLAYERNFFLFKRFCNLILLLNLFIGVFIFFANENIKISNILNPGKTYIDALEANKQQLLSNNFTSLLIQFKTLFSSVFYFTNVFFIYFYRKYSKKWRLIFVISISIQLLNSVLQVGAQKNFFDLFFMVSLIVFLRIFLNKKYLTSYIKNVLFGLLIVIGLFIFFQLSRFQEYNALDFSGYGQMYLNKESILFDIFGEKIGFGLSLLICYISQGYYGLSLTLQLPFEWTYGVGNSFALMSYADQYLDINSVLEKTYPFRMQEQFGWPALMYWHTFFPWVASDISFPGVLVLMYFTGRTFARTFAESVRYSNPLSVTLFFFISILLLYMPANNQLMQTREMMIGFVTILVVWVINHKKYNYAKE